MCKCVLKNVTTSLITLSPRKFKNSKNDFRSHFQSFFELIIFFKNWKWLIKRCRIAVLHWGVAAVCHLRDDKWVMINIITQQSMVIIAKNQFSWRCLLSYLLLARPLIYHSALNRRLFILASRRGKSSVNIASQRLWNVKCLPHLFSGCRFIRNGR